MVLMDGATTTEAAPPFAIFEGWVPRTMVTGLGEEKMDMLRHDYVTDDYEWMTLADLLRDFERTTRGRDRESGASREGDGVASNLW